ncbi:endo-1,5-alpha-L-arabinosidase [Exidia glandulosa HHB12029]|uniref:Arabinan endo-1,5-alpha-L-arabinosidase n=1 Tax=Exidia glandulosa HHB12029 TaxID=1314781 RepID=A0A165PYI1_EXIGL|nr:endo-1,5-alpha-L-arabinosidase [Exidia glandulosa HHB12029]
MRFSLSFTLLLAQSLSLFAFSSAATPNPLPGSADITARDPAIFYNADTKKYFVFATGAGIRIFQSSSLTGPWKRTGSVLKDQCSIIDHPGKCSNIWAPDVAKVNGTYTLYYSVSSLGKPDSAIGVAQSKTMEPGSWTDLGEVIRSKSGDNVNAIDPNLVKDKDGKLSLVFGSWWNGMYEVPLKNVKTPAKALPGTHLAGSSGRAAEGGFVYKSPDSDWWFMFFSEGKTPLGGETTRPPKGKEYRVRVGRSKSPSGPFVDKTGDKLTVNMSPPSGWPILESHDNVYAPGGQSLFRDPVSKRDVIVYHYVKKNEKPGGPSYLGINYVDFKSGWPVLVDVKTEKPKPTPAPAPAPTPPPSSCSKPTRSRAR